MRCPNCHKQCADNLPHCPHCNYELIGHIIKRLKFKKIQLYLFLFILFACLVIPIAYFVYQFANYIPSRKNADNLMVDFQPYMQKMQKNIKSNWNPPKLNESNKVVMLFTIHKDGSVTDIKIKQSSGIKEVDEATIKALEDSVPFEPLPANFKDESVDILFNFDYNIILKNDE